MNPLTPHEVRQVAAEGVVSDRTVANYLHGRSVWSTTRERIERALRVLGLEDRAREQRGDV